MHPVQRVDVRWFRLCENLEVEGTVTVMGMYLSSTSQASKMCRSQHLTRCPQSSSPASVLTRPNPGAPNNHQGGSLVYKDRIQRKWEEKWEPRVCGAAKEGLVSALSLHGHESAQDSPSIVGKSLAYKVFMLFLGHRTLGSHQVERSGPILCNSVLTLPETEVQP